MNNDKPNYSFVLNYKKTLLEILSPKETIIHSKDFEVGFFKIQALMELDKFAEAQELISSLEGIDSPSVYKGLIKTVELVIDKQFESALSNALSLVEKSPENRDLLIIISRLYLQLGQNDRAIDAYSDYLAAYPKDTSTKFMVAVMMIDLLI